MAFTCIRCDTELSDDMQFCPNCGAQTFAGTTPYDLYENVPTHCRVGKANDDLHPEWISQYKGSMGFSRDLNNFVHADLSLEKTDGSPKWLVKLLGMNDVISPGVLLSIEPNGLLIIGLHVVSHVPLLAQKIKQINYSQYYYYFSKQNGFIPKSEIMSFNLHSEDKSKTLTVKTAKQIFKFKISPFWDWRPFQTMNYMNL